MDSNQNPWECWQAGSAGSHLTDTVGDKEILPSTTTPHFSVPNSDWQFLGGESWQELEQLPSWWNTDSDSEDHRRNAFSSGLFESIEIPIPSPNCEFRSEFRVELNGNSHASSESCKNFPVAGDGDVDVGMCSRTTQGPSPKRNHTTAAKIAQNLVPLRNQKKMDGVKKTGRRHRGPNWSLQENRSFLQHMEVEVQVQVQKRKPPWKAISQRLSAMGFVREAKACEDHWGVLLADLKKFENHFGSDNILRDLHFWPSVGTMSREQRSQNGLPLVFEVEWFEAMARIVTDRAKHRKSRSECFKGRIHVAGTPASSSCRQQSRVCAASATTSSEIFDNPVGDGDGIRELVELLGSNDRNVTVDQILEVRRMRLEAQKMDLRRQEIELERDRMYMYQGQRNGLLEKARRPLAAHEWN